MGYGKQRSAFCPIIQHMNKADAIIKAGSIANLSRILGITTNAISNWKEGPIPNAREWQLKLLRPEWFDAAQAKDKP